MYKAKIFNFVKVYMLTVYESNYFARISRYANRFVPEMPSAKMPSSEMPIALFILKRFYLIKKNYVEFIF